MLEEMSLEQLFAEFDAVYAQAEIHAADAARAAGELPTLEQLFAESEARAAIA
jgi:hypothetical protein